MINENVQKYMTLTLVFYLATALLSAGSFFIVDNSLGDSTTGTAIEEIVDNIDSVLLKLTNANNIIDYTLLIGYALYHGIIIIISFLVLVFNALEPIALLLQIPYAVYHPIQLVIDCIIIYEFAKMLFNR